MQSSPTSEVPGPEVVKIIDQSREDEVVFAADADSLFVLNGKSIRLSEVPDEELVDELARKGSLR
jgi:hypothetical protein